MADRSILYRLRAALQGGYVAVANEIETLATYVGLFNGVNNVETALQRIDGTGVGSSIFRFTGSYAAQNSNISEWFGGRQLTRMRCTSNGGLNPAVFTLPGTTALNTAFDQLATAGLEEVIRFVIEYTGPSSAFLSIVPRSGGPQIQGTTSIPVRSGIAATVEITRTSGTISSYVFDSIGGIGDTTGGTLDTIKLINPATDVWNASTNGTLPSSGVIKGNAYRVANAPTDGSGRFGEVMQNGDWVVWEGETFTSWAAEPHAWFVLPAHEVRRISALEVDFLNTMQVSSESDRNTVIRGADYADTAAEIRLKIYPTAGDYTPADLNTTGDIDAYTDASNQTGVLAIRLPGTNASLATVLPTLYVYSENSSGEFTRLFNLEDDFTFEGDFTAESDYVSVETISYTAGDTIRVYVAEEEDRFQSPDLDITYDNLLPDVQARIDRSEPWYSAAQALFSGATVRDDQLAARIEYASGYTHAIDWRDMTQSTTVNDNRYIDGDLSITADHISFEISGFGVGLQKLISVGLQRNDSQTGTGAMIELAPGVAFMRINDNNRVQFNTTPGSGSTTWVDLTAAAGAVTLGSGSDNFLLFELNPLNPDNPTGHWDVVAALYDGTNYHQCNNITFAYSGTVTGDHIGMSRSLIQRGQITRFNVINSPGYLLHSRLEDLLRHNTDDKWNFGFARQIAPASDREVELASVLEIGNRIVLTASPNNTKVMLVVDDTDTSNLQLGVQEI